MRWIASHVFTVVALAGLLQTGAFAQDGSEVISLRSEVEALRREVNTGMTAGYDDKKPVPVAAGAPAGGDCGCGNHGGCGSCGCGQSCCNSCCNNCCNNNCCCETGGTCGCFEPCCHCPGLTASAELMFFRYHRADGVRVGTAEPDDEVEFDFEPTVRLSLGWMRDDGLGARLRYWEFDHAQTANEGAPSQLSVDTYTFDFEVFDTFCLNRNWDLEIAAGVRYNEFEEVMFDDEATDDLRVNNFSGYGGVASAELRRLVGTSGSIWVRARTAILMEDKDVFNINGGTQQVRLIDVTVGMTELAFGYDLIAPLANGAYAFAGVQAEWQNWYNFSSGFEDTEDNEDFAGPSDVGFGGFGFRVGVAR